MFNLDQIDKIADLARLQLTRQERETLARQFETILNYFSKIESAVLPQEEGEEIAFTEAELREDRAEPSGISPGDFSAYMESGHFKVPKVIE